MLVPALQTTPAASDNGNLDALTLVLVVVFIASMAALTALAMRRTRPKEPEADPFPTVVPIERKDAPVAERPSLIQSRATVAGNSPVWLTGVSLPNTPGRVAEASRIIEELLAARRERDLARGLALYSPALRGELQAQFGVDEAGLLSLMREATFAGEPPDLRSVEIVDATGGQMTARAGYTDGTSETYWFVRDGDDWLIDGIDRR